MKLSTPILLVPMAFAGCAHTGASQTHPSKATLGLPEPLPTVDLAAQPIKISGDGQTVEIKDVRLTGDLIESPVGILSAALRKYDQAKFFKMNWQISVGSSWRSDKIVYNRQANALKFDDKGGQGHFQSESHVLYTQVTDAVIHNAAKRTPGGHDATGFLSLHKLGAKRSKFNYKDNKN